MKKILLALFIVLSVAAAKAQNTATNFTANDCNGVLHDLFTELDAGKVVVIAWVMPCGTCTGPAVTAHNVVESFATSHPGKVIYYVADDYANTTCATLTNYANSSIATGLTIFSDNAITMSDYGTNGMPKIVVIGGSNRNVYFNKNDGASNDAAGIQNAINQALADILDVPSIAAVNNAKWIWDASSKTGSLHFSTNAAGAVKYTVFNLLGQPVVPSENKTIAAGNQVIEVNAQQLPTGTYFLRVNFNGRTSTYKISVQ